MAYEKSATDLMKRSHRRIHLVIWPLLAVALIAVIYLALASRVDTPLNDLPAALSMEVR